jgi:hypothetical protein
MPSSVKGKFMGALKCCRKRAFSAMIRVWTKNIEERLYNEF